MAKKESMADKAGGFECKGEFCKDAHGRTKSDPHYGDKRSDKHIMGQMFIDHRAAREQRKKK